MPVFLGYLLLGVALTVMAREYARRAALLDLPGERRSHAVPTPRGGGIAIVLSSLLALGLLARAKPSLVPELALAAAGLALVAAVGWLDDHRPLSAWRRLLVHFAAGGCLGVSLVYAGASPAEAVVGGAACVVLINVWNFMDGINGLAASQFALVMGFVAAAGGGPWAALGIPLMATALGFLPFNFPRASIFLGDVGSGAMGFLVAGLLAHSALGRVEAPAATAAFLLLPSAFLIDAGWTLAGRVVRREAWWEPHVQHTYQIWARRRGGHALVTFAYAIWTGLGCLLAWRVSTLPTHFILGSVMAWYTSGSLLWWLLRRRDARSRPRNAVEMRDA